MGDESIGAYDLPERVRRYDADMDIMHPLRGEMIDVALGALPFQATRSLRALDLGVGTGVFSKKLLEKYPSSAVTAVDGAAAMLELARARLGELAQHVEWVLSDFRVLPETLLTADRFDVILSSYALHHLNTEEKLAVLTSVIRALKPGGWLLNADLVVAEDPAVERRIQEIRVQTVTERAPAGDDRFSTAEVTRRFLDDLEAKEQDQPQTLSEDIRIIKVAGIANAEVFWKELREVVIGGFKVPGSCAQPDWE